MRSVKLTEHDKRNGTANLFVFLDTHKSWRHVKVTDHRAACDFAHCMRDLADTHYPDADRIRVVMDNLSTHTAGALYETFPAPEAHRILQRLEFHMAATAERLGSPNSMALYNNKSPRKARSRLS